MEDRIAKHTQSIEKQSISEIRSLLSNFADENIDELKNSIQDIVQQTISQISSDQRVCYLDMLILEFPVLTDICSVTRTEGGDQASVISEENYISENFEDLILRLSQIYLSVENTEKEMIRKTLEQYGLYERVVIKEVKPQCSERNTESKELDCFTSLMAEFISSLSPFIWGLWKSMDSDIKFAPSGVLYDRLRELSRNSSKCKGMEEAFELNKLKHLTTAILTSSNSIGSKIMTVIMPRISPERIESDVKMEGANFLTSIEVKCWKKYKQRYHEQLSYEWMENEIKKIVSVEVESFLKTFNQSS